MTAPDRRDHPLETDGLEGLGLGSPARPVVPHALVPDVEHPLPVLLDGLSLAGAVNRRRAVALGRPLELVADAAPEVEGAEDRGDPPAEARGLLARVLPPGGGRQGAR